MQEQLYLSCMHISNAFQVFFSHKSTIRFKIVLLGHSYVIFQWSSRRVYARIHATKILLLQFYAKYCCYRFVWNIITRRKEEKNEVLRARDSKKDEPKAGRRRRNVRECRDNPVERERGTRKRTERNEEEARSCSREGRLNSTRGQCLESEIGPNQFQADKTRVVVSTEVFA